MSFSPLLQDVDYESMTDDLRRQGWTFFSNLVSDVFARALRDEALSLYADDQFRRAKIGPTDEELLRNDVRRDSILWLDPLRLSSLQQQFSEMIETMMREFGSRLFMSLKSFEAHYALYPNGGYYKKHIDQFQSDGMRQLSFVIYLNDNWTENDGGQLRIFSEQAPEKIDIDVCPRLGTAVLFLSPTIYHEVLPTLKPRVSLTGWMKRELFAPGTIV